MITICVLQGDQTGQELLDEALRVMDPSVIGMSQLAFETFDLSLENRRRTKNEVVREAAARILETGLGIKAATITPGDPDDVGSPNALLRELVDGSVVLAHRTADPLSDAAGGCACAHSGGAHGG